MQKSLLFKISYYSFLLLSTSFLNAQTCEISNVFAKAYECNDDGSFLIDVTFDVVNPGNLGFSIKENGMAYIDTLAYGQSTYTIGPFFGDCTTYYTFAIVDNANNNCKGFYTFNEPVCCSTSDCDISVSNITLSDCDSSGYRTLMFDVENVGNSTLGFDLLYRNAPVTTFNYGNNPYSISIPGVTYVHELVIKDRADPICRAFLNIENNDDCSGFEHCEFLNIRTSHEFVCTSDTTYLAYTYFDYDGESDSIYLVFNNSTAEAFSINENPILLGEFLVSNELFEYYLHDQNDVFCFTGSEWNDAPDCSNYENCDISKVFAEAQECNVNGLFYVDIEFIYSGIGNKGFEIRGNGVSYGDTFQYGQTFYTVGPLEGDCYTLFEFVVIDNVNPECNAFYEFEETVCCVDVIECDIRDIQVDSFTCNDDGTYGLILNFVYEGNTNDFFDVWAGNDFIGFYRYDALPIFIDTFYARDVEYDLIRICDNDNDACCAIHEFIGPDCDEEENCGIYGVFAEAHECTNDSLFYVDIEFQSENVGINGFEIRANGVSYGDTFQYGQTFYTIGPLEADCETIYEFVVIDNDNSDCQNEYNFDAPICCGEELICNIRDIVVDSFFCNEDGTYGLVLNFVYEGNTNDFFDVWASDNYVGFYRYNDLPVFIDTFYPRDVEYDLIKICDNDNDACCAIHEFMGPDCDEEENCGIYEVFAEAHECTSDSLFYVDIEFQFENIGSNGFEIRGNGVSYGDTFQYGQTFYTIGPLEGDCETVYEFVVIDNDDPDCRNDYSFVEPICCGEEIVCDIRDIVVDSFFCNDDGTYGLVLNFVYEGNTNDFFDVWAGNEFVGFYRYDALPIFIDTFYARDVEYDLIRICDNDNEDCCAGLEFLGPDCDDIIDSVTDRPINRLDIYSNNKKLFINAETEINYSVSIYNLNGQLISKSVAQGDLIKSTEVPDGVYLVKVFDLKNGGFVSKLLYF